MAQSTLAAKAAHIPYAELRKYGPIECYTLLAIRALHRSGRAWFLRRDIATYINDVLCIPARPESISRALTRFLENGCVSYYQTASPTEDMEQHALPDGTYFFVKGDHHGRPGRMYARTSMAGDVADAYLDFMQRIIDTAGA